MNGCKFDLDGTNGMSRATNADYGRRTIARSHVTAPVLSEPVGTELRCH